MTDQQTQRLAQMRAHLEMFEAEGEDVGTWEATFYLDLLDEKNAYIRTLEELCSSLQQL